MKLKGQLLTANASLVLADGATGQTTLTSASTGTRVLTFPDATTTLVGHNNAQTLTNKIISGASNTLTVRLANDVSGILPVANGGTGQAVAFVAGGVGYGVSGTSLSVSAAGTTGQALLSGGTGQPSWSAALTVSSGAVTLGSAVTGNLTGAVHTISGSLYGGNVTSTDTSGGVSFGANVRTGVATADQGRTNTTTGGSGIRILNRTADSSNGIFFMANLASDATSTNAATTGAITQQGRWQIGTSGASLNHLVNGNWMMSTAGGYAGVSTTNGTFLSANAYYDGTQYAASSTGSSFIIDMTYNTGCRFLAGASVTGGTAVTPLTTVGSCSALGQWSFGASAGNVTHTFSANTTVASAAVKIQNLDTTTGSNGSFCLQLLKGSTTNTANANRFLIFGINAGATDSGYIGSNGANAAAFFNTSDARLKQDVVSLTTGLDIISALRPVEFAWKSDPSSRAVGFIAQEVAAVVDGVVGEPSNPDEHYSMCRENLIPYMVAAIKELKAEFDAYKVAHP